MKKLIISFLMTVVVFTSSAQAYTALVDSNAIWSDFYASGYPPNYTSMVSTWIRFSGDTVINSKHYTRIFKSLDLQHLTWTEDGYIREDSIGRVYGIIGGSGTEELMYDFSLEVGDTFDSYSVTNVSFISINGSMRKQIHFFATPEIWIEGLGCTTGVLNFRPAFIVGGDYDLLCYYYNDSLVYNSQIYPQCYYSIYNGQQFLDAVRPEIFPNPVSSTLHIRFNKPVLNEMAMKVFDINGCLVYSANMQPHFSIYNKDMSSFSSGLYFLQLVSLDHISSHKIMIYR